MRRSVRVTVPGHWPEVAGRLVRGGDRDPRQGIMRHSTMRVTKGALVVAVVVCGLASFVPGVRGQVPRAHPDLQQFFAASGTDDDPADDAIDAIAAAWRDGYAGIVWDIHVPVPRSPSTARRAIPSGRCSI